MEGTLKSETKNEDLDSILAQLDKKLENREGVLPGNAWRYREEVRIKYNLPECGYRWEDPRRYIDEIESIF